MKVPRSQIWEAIDALARRAIKSRDIRKDLGPFDLLRALIGVARVASSPDRQHSARAWLLDILFRWFAANQRKKIGLEWPLSDALRCMLHVVEDFKMEVLV
jgi:hypothetical protein